MLSNNVCRFIKQVNSYAPSSPPAWHWYEYAYSYGFRVETINHSESIPKELFTPSNTASLVKNPFLKIKPRLFGFLISHPQATHYNNVKTHAARVVSKKDSLLIKLC